MGRIKTELHTNDVFYAQLRRVCFLGVRGGWCVGWTGRAGEGEHVLLLYPMRNEWGGGCWEAVVFCFAYTMMEFMLYLVLFSFLVRGGAVGEHLGVTGWRQFSHFSFLLFAWETEDSPRIGCAVESQSDKEMSKWMVGLFLARRRHDSGSTKRVVEDVPTALPRV